jgi:hypothetical protein
MKAYGRMDVNINVFLTSALVGGEWLASRPLSLYPSGKSPWYPLGGPQNRSGRSEEERILSVVQPVASHYTDYAGMIRECGIVSSVGGISRASIWGVIVVFVGGDSKNFSQVVCIRAEIRTGYLFSFCMMCP